MEGRERMRRSQRLESRCSQNQLGGAGATERRATSRLRCEASIEPREVGKKGYRGRLPRYNLVKTSDFVDRVRVFLEYPTLTEDWRDDDAYCHAILITRRSDHWASAFVDHTPPSK